MRQPGQGGRSFALTPEETKCWTRPRKLLSFAEEFKNFALKGNVIDLAVGVIIGGAFGGIVKSLVEKIIMPLVSIVMPAEHGYTEWVGR